MFSGADAGTGTPFPLQIQTQRSLAALCRSRCKFSGSGRCLDEMLPLSSHCRSRRLPSKARFRDASSGFALWRIAMKPGRAAFCPCPARLQRICREILHSAVAQPLGKPLVIRHGVEVSRMETTGPKMPSSRDRMERTCPGQGRILGLFAKFFQADLGLCRAEGGNGDLAAPQMPLSPKTARTLETLLKYLWNGSSQRPRTSLKKMESQSPPTPPNDHFA